MPILTYLLEYNRYLNILGIFVILAIAFLFSFNRAAIKIKLVINALLIQVVLGFVMLKTSTGQRIVEKIAYYIGKMYQFADEGAGFIFGNLANTGTPWGFIFAVKVLPVIIFFGGITSLLFHWGIIQKIVQGIHWLIRPFLATTGAETACAIANSFLGATEAPLLIKNYLSTMTTSEIFVVMVSGMATISGALLVVFGSMGIATKHLLASSVMAIPSSLLIAKIIVPEVETTNKQVHHELDAVRQHENALGALITGTLDGLSLAVNIAAMLITFFALIAMINYFLSFGCYKINHLFSYGGLLWRLPDGVCIESIFAYVFAPFGFLLGFTGNDALAAGQLIGIKVAVNELIAYKHMIALHLSDRARDIITYALCGFSNFVCIGIQVGGIGALIPQRRTLLTQLGLYAVLAGTLSNLLSAMIAALLL